MFYTVYNKLNTFYEGLFSAYGRFLAKNYFYIILVAFVANVLLSAGSFRMKLVVDTDELFIPTSGEAKRDEYKIEKLFSREKLGTYDFYLHQLVDFGQWGEVNFITCPDKNEFQENILQKKYADRIDKFNTELLERTKLEINGTTITYGDVCARQNGDCLIDGTSLLSPGFYEVKLDQFMRRKELRAQENKILNRYQEKDETKSDEFRFYFAGFSLTDLSYNLGRYFRVNTLENSLNGTEPGYSKFLKLRYNLKINQKHSLETVKRFELELLKNIQDLIKEDPALLSCNDAGSMRVSYSVSASIDIEMVNNIELDRIYVCATFVIIMLAATFMMSLGSTWITAPGFLLPSTGLVSALFGVTSAFGFLSWFGYDGCSLIFVIPFLVFGVGIDDMFIIYSAFKRNLDGNQNNFKVSKLISDSLSKSGVAITITSLTDFTAFIIGLVADFRSVQIFCVYTAFSIAFCYIYQLTIFGGFLVIHANRIKKQRNCVLFCVEQEKLASIMCCKPSRTESVTGLSALKMSISSAFIKFWTAVFEFLITKKLGKAISIFLFIVYISLSTWSASKIHEGINLTDLVADNSYYKTYITDNIHMINLNPIVMFVINEPIDYDDVEIRIKIRKLLENAQKLEHMSKSFSLNWLDNFSDDPLNYKDDPTDFKMNLYFLPHFKNDVVLEKVPATGKYQISASRFYLQYNEVFFSSKDAIPMKLLRNLCSDSGLPVTVYSIPFKFYEQFEAGLPSIIQTFLISTQAMFVIGIIFIPDLISVLVILLTMFSIMLGLIGALNLMSISISTISMIIIIMSIGFCIDFSAHIVHAFIADSGKGTRDERAYKAVLRVGIPILNSAFSTFLGISLLYFCDSYLFEAFFKSVSILMILGMINALFFLPVLLSFIGPHWPVHQEEGDDMKKDQNIGLKLMENIENGSQEKNTTVA